MEDTSTEAHTEVLTQEQKQGERQHHYRQETNPKQERLLRTLPQSPFWINYQSEGENSCTADRQGTFKSDKIASAESYLFGTAT
jgi:hypothetical protein